jgi:GNAT superfamily N-acetyltransferase
MVEKERVRIATDAELDRLGGMFERTHFHPALASACRFAREALAGEVFVAARDGELLGASGCASFGASGWIGAVAVVPEARRAGLGHALTDAALTWLRDSGMATIHLHATEMGRPIYERLGFVAEGTCVSLGGSRRRPRRFPGVRPARPGDLAAALALDREATGEDRTGLLAALWPQSAPGEDRPGPTPATVSRPRSGPGEGRPGPTPTTPSRPGSGPGEQWAGPRTTLGSGSALVAEADGRVVGFHLAGPWRPGGATVAADPASGLALLAATGGRPDGALPPLSAPEDNTAAIRAMEALGHAERSRTTRMRLGPPIPWRPTTLFSTFNLFWG